MWEEDWRVAEIDYRVDRVVGVGQACERNGSEKSKVKLGHLSIANGWGYQIARTVKTKFR